jgi:hypothetical protein
MKKKVERQNQLIVPMFSQSSSDFSVNLGKLLLKTKWRKIIFAHPAIFGILFVPALNTLTARNVDYEIACDCFVRLESCGKFCDLQVLLQFQLTVSHSTQPSSLKTSKFPVTRSYWTITIRYGITTESNHIHLM